ncbi:MAG: hypothetical protein H3C48_06485 [Chitinophagaceae bacterium]|nr:hypothetical protein [Chitinophagaceae bacterium]
MMTNWKIIVFFLAGTLVLLLLLRFQGRQLITPHAPAGILSLEFSYQIDDTHAIVQEWKPSLRTDFHVNMLLDFLFIPFYGLFLYSTCGFFSVLFKKGWAQRLGVLFAFGSLLAMVFDVVENMAMCFSYHFYSTQFLSGITTGIALLKFLLAGLAVLYSFLSAFFLLIFWKRKLKNG